MIILASSSPRRAKLLSDAGITFRVVPSKIVETFDNHKKPQELVIGLASMKALDVAMQHPQDIILGADTIVVYHDEVLGKPKDKEDAYRMLKMLSGEHHTVYTGVALVKADQIKTFYSEAEVVMKPLSDIEINNYIQSGEPLDKAGAYAIQGKGSALVESYKGDFLTIVGLPLKDVLEMLETFK